MLSTNTGLGFRAHSGWAVLVAVAGPAGSPSVVDRRRVELADRGIKGSAQPYHAAALLNFQEAEAYLRSCTDATARMARDAVRQVVAELSEKGHPTAACCVLAGSGRPTPSLAATLASHPLIHTAEGEFYRNALKSACERCGLTVGSVRERELWSHAAQVLGMSKEELERRIALLGKSMGPPWRQDEKLAALAAWTVLAG
jgi:hypothetical protein